MCVEAIDAFSSLYLNLSWLLWFVFLSQSQTSLELLLLQLLSLPPSILSTTNSAARASTSTTPMAFPLSTSPSATVAPYASAFPMLISLPINPKSIGRTTALRKFSLPLPPLKVGLLLSLMMLLILLPNLLFFPLLIGLLKMSIPTPLMLSRYNLFCICHHIWTRFFILLFS